MAAGQQMLGTTLDVASLTAAQIALEAEATARASSHGRRLRAVLDLDQGLTGADFALMVTSQLALVEQTSEQAATGLLHQARLLASLDGGLASIDSALLHPHQAEVLTRQLHGLDPAVQAAAWATAHTALARAADRQSVLPPARFAEVLHNAVITADPQDATARRKQAEAAGDVEFRRRDDGLGDLTATGITAPNLRAILMRIRDRAHPFGGQDTRTAGKRRLDAFVDLLLGRDQLPLDDDQDPFAGDEARHCGPACGCRLGEPVPCGAQLTVLVPIGAALGTTDELAELTGHGPLEPDLLQDLLHNAPELRAGYVDEHGTPVAVGDRVERPPARDPDAVREALLRLAASTPPRPPEPSHPDDHARPTGPDDPGPPAFDETAGRNGPLDVEAAADGVTRPPGSATASRNRVREAVQPTLSRAALRGPQVLTNPHPQGTPGRYRIPTRLARLLRLRAPRCEWPGCGISAARCDLDHDRAWPHGPTCGCNLGPLCRRHHRIKQLAMTKHRDESHVRWTDPTGRTWTSPTAHQPPAAPVRDLPPLRDPHGPARDEDGDQPDDGVEPTHAPDPMTAPDPQGDPYDRIWDDGWGLALTDPTRWDD